MIFVEISVFCVVQEKWFEFKIGLYFGEYGMLLGSFFLNGRDPKEIHRCAVWRNK